uniref:Carboxylesterase type B domain-containing protein n=1 Tax=Plectus sambesii TaxID=2011161 RepID=A0A914WCQ9_9BILA
MDIADLTDDIMIYVPTFDSGEAMRHKGATVYKYSFEYDKIGDAFAAGAKAADKESLFHGQDLVYVMGLRYGKFTPKDEKIQELYGGMFADFIKTGNPSPPNIDPWQPTDDRNNYFLINFDDDNNMPGNTNGFHVKAVQFWTKTAPEIDQSSSMQDGNDTFRAKRFEQDLIYGLKKMGKKVGRDIEDEIEQWKVDPHVRSEEEVDRFEQVQSGRIKSEHDQVYSQRNAVLDQRMERMLNQIVPSVRNKTTTSDSKDAGWEVWSWVASGVCVVLAVMLLLTCCSTCYEYSKRRQYERITETTVLSPSAVKTYG